jgi:hypothetical protein
LFLPSAPASASPARPCGGRRIALTAAATATASPNIYAYSSNARRNNEVSCSGESFVPTLQKNSKQVRSIALNKPRFARIHQKAGQTVNRFAGIGV